jgi:hypothetical protein
MKKYFVPATFLLSALCLVCVYAYQYNKDLSRLPQTSKIDRTSVSNEPDSPSLPQTDRVKPTKESDSFTTVTNVENLPLSQFRENGFNEEHINFFKKRAITVGDEEYVLIVQSPLSVNVVYINPNSYLDENTYAVNKKTGSIQIIEAALPQKVGSDEYVFRLIGANDSRILFIKQHIEDSPGPCWNPWVFVYGTQQKGTYYDTEARRIKALDIENNDFIDFIVSEEKRDTEWKIVEECNAAFTE